MSYYCSFTAAVANTQFEVNVVRGDTNGDGVVDIADINGVINCLLGKTSPVVTVDKASIGLTPVYGGTFQMGLDNYPIAPALTRFMILTMTEGFVRILSYVS